MNNYFLKLKNWFEPRSTREKWFIVFLNFLILYLLFDNLFFKNISQKEQLLTKHINENQYKINAWQMQIDTINSMIESDLYHKWLAQQRAFSHLKGKYKLIMQIPPNKQWLDVVRTLLQKQKNITLVQIKNFPETAYQEEQELQQGKLFQQRLAVIFYSNYLDTLNYLKELELALASIRWDNFSYKVSQYPNAKVELEFSILYEKS